MIRMEPTQDADPAGAARLIVRAVLQLGRRLRAQRPAASVSLSKLAILATLHRAGPMAAARLAVLERLKPQSLTRLVAQMEAEGLIGRRTAPGDRRTKVIAITRKGRSVLGRDIRHRRRWLQAALARQLTPQEQSLLRVAADLLLKLAAYEDAGESTPH